MKRRWTEPLAFPPPYGAPEARGFSIVSLTRDRRGARSRHGAATALPSGLTCLDFRSRFGTMPHRRSGHLAPWLVTVWTLLAAAPGSAPSRRAIVVDVFKEYPVGNSRAWLPRALSEDDLESVTLLTSPYARVVELHPGPNPIAAASAFPAARPQPAR